MNDYQNYKKLSNEIRKKSKISECLWSKKCNKAIGSHSIQNNGILSKISENNHIYSFQAVPKDGSLEFQLQKKGKNEFSVFNGFCSYHDKEIFKPIEDNVFQNTKEQQYLFAFRALSKEYHTKKESFLTCENTRKQIVSQYQIGAQINHAEELILEVLKKKCKDENYYCLKFNNLFNTMKKDIENRNYDRLHTYYYSLIKEYPIVTNTCFIPYSDIENNPLYTDKEYIDTQVSNFLPVVLLNVFPKDGKTHVLFSFFKKDLYKFSVFKQQISKDIKQSVSKLILQYAENTGFSPSYIKEYFTESEITKIRLAFEETLHQDASIPQVKSVNLFRDKKINE